MLIAPSLSTDAQSRRYEYVVGGDKYGNTFEKPFIEPESGASMPRYLIKG
jgi:hypothetical protein